MKYRRPTRIPDFDYIGEHAYFVTACTCERRRWFEDAAIVEVALTQLLRTGEEYGFAIIVYCFMPDHIHLVPEGRREDADLRLFMKVFKQRAVYYTRDLRDDDLWQEGYYEHVIRGEETATKTARYVLENPVRAELVNDPEEYPFSGSSVYKIHDILVGLV
jgi:REP-associated tyrosine transposase